MILRYLFILAIGTNLLLLAQTITGTWKITNKVKPYNFASTVSYDASFRFNTDGSIELLGQSGNIMDSTRQYDFNNNELRVYLKNKNNGGINNFLLGNLSSRTYILTPINTNCFNGVDSKDKSNTFKMCKTKNL